MFDKLRQLARDWHEAGRAGFELRFPSVDYDKFEPKSVVEKQKYYYLDEGTSGVYMVEKKTGDIYRIKAYGKIHRQKLCGNVASVTGQELHNLRWW